MNDRTTLQTWGVVGAVLVLVLVSVAGLWPDYDLPYQGVGQMHLRDFAALLCVDGGRVKPVDTVARTQMMVLSAGRQEYRDPDDHSQQAVRWLLDQMALGLAEYYQQVQVVTVTDSDLLKFLKLQPKPGGRYEFAELAPVLTAKVAGAPQGKDTVYHRELQRIMDSGLKPDQLTPFDRAFMDMAQQRLERQQRSEAIREHLLVTRKIHESPVYRIDNDQLLDLLGLERRSGFRYSLKEVVGADKGEGFERLKKQVDTARGVDEKNRSLLDSQVLALADRLNAAREDEPLVQIRMKEEFDMARRMRRQPPRLPFQIVPPAAGSPDQEWQMFGPALLRADLEGVNDPSTRAIEEILFAYGTGNVQKFNSTAATFLGIEDTRFPAESARARFELFFNALAPFYWCMIVYVFAFLLVCGSFAGYRTQLSRAAFWLMLLTVVVHTWALAARMYLQGRPPVTNLYSSAVFIGWGAVLLCLVMEWWFRNGLSALVGAVVGFATLIIAQHLGGSGDTLEMLQAVLDTNFWLATHVTCVTLGYTATFVAGFFGILYVVLGVFTTELNPVTTTGKTLSRIIYGVVCFATLLSFVGTVLGGIWADQSWGRFWGWDPKENGALLIVIMNALVLHARWAGMVKARGMALLVIAGNIVTAWSWFGTNQLGVGLHAYGFNKTLAEGCRWFWLSQLALIGVGLIPLRYWRSFSDQRKPSLAPSNGPLPMLAQPTPALAGVGAGAVTPGAAPSAPEPRVRKRNRRNGR